MAVCKERPERLPNLDILGLTPKGQPTAALKATRNGPNRNKVGTSTPMIPQGRDLSVRDHNISALENNPNNINNSRDTYGRNIGPSCGPASVQVSRGKAAKTANFGPGRPVVQDSEDDAGPVISAAFQFNGLGMYPPSASSPQI